MTGEVIALFRGGIKTCAVSRRGYEIAGALVMATACEPTLTLRERHCLEPLRRLLRRQGLILRPPVPHSRTAFVLVAWGRWRSVTACGRKEAGRGPDRSW